MNYDRYFLINCMMGDELYKEKNKKKATVSSSAVEKQFNLLAQKPLDKYIRSGMPWLRAW
ncbi:hypothetical protein [Tellurirhabdus bombi]|uniref:hypothetical protein n=1 Tax=Tellurirhabdus bombi TaxID=2907205 RepID=UPI001F175316|nr:hypothetical protein [Tellurirhabdus bombi]